MYEVVFFSQAVPVAGLLDLGNCGIGSNSPRNWAA
jgi:hypothetical protein